MMIKCVKTENIQSQLLETLIVCIRYNQNELIERICKLNNNTVVVLNTGAPCEMPWINDATAALQCWFPGQEFGNSLSDVIFGNTNPSGKLPTTFPKSLKDTPAFSTYPGNDLQMDYEEGLFIGYRWYDKEDIKTLFHFGRHVINFHHLPLHQNMSPFGTKHASKPMG